MLELHFFPEILLSKKIQIVIAASFKVSALQYSSRVASTLCLTNSLTMSCEYGLAPVQSPSPAQCQRCLILVAKVANARKRL